MIYIALLQENLFSAMLAQTTLNVIRTENSRFSSALATSLHEDKYLLQKRGHLFMLLTVKSKRFKSSFVNQRIFSYTACEIRLNTDNHLFLDMRCRVFCHDSHLGWHRFQNVRLQENNKN